MNMEASTQAKEERATVSSTARVIREVYRKTRKRFSAEDKIRIVLEGFRKEMPVTDLCRHEGIHFLVAHISQIPLKRSFDVITCFDVLEHVDDLDHVLSSLKNLKKPI